MEGRPGTEVDVLVLLRLLLQQGTADGPHRQLLVHRIGLDVLGVVLDHLRGEVEPLQAARDLAGRCGAGGLEGGEEAERGGAQAAVQPQHAHHVVLLEHRERGIVDIGAVLGGEAARGEPLREEVRVQALRVATAVLVVLQLHHRRLDRIGQARDRPRGVVGLLERVDRLVPQELQRLLLRGGAVQVRGGRRAVVRGDEREEVLGEVARGGRFRGPLTQLLLQLLLEPPPERDQLRVPFQLVGHVVETAVVQLEQGPQRDLGVVRVVGRGKGRRSGGVPGAQRVQGGLAQRSAGGRGQHAASIVRAGACGTLSRGGRGGIRILVSRSLRGQARVAPGHLESSVHRRKERFTRPDGRAARGVSAVCCGGSPRRGSAGRRG